ncbi:MAG: hypothetical protein GY850_38700 [bacterium]|nr:hypothetical protein [bacterium]
MAAIEKYLCCFLIAKTKKWIISRSVRALIAAVSLGLLNPAYAIQISDDPMDTQVQSAAANLMFVLDNSGSMDWEFLTEDDDGKFEGNIEYLFDDPRDNTYQSPDSNGTILAGSNRAKWKSQWSGHNKIYYDPSTDYLPWPQTDNYPFTDADTGNPRSNPVNAAHTFDLTVEYFSIANLVGEVIVDNTDAGFSVNAENDWSTSSYNNDVGGDYRYNNPLSSDTWAQWTPTLPEAGSYRIYVWFRTLDTRHDNISYTIGHVGGPSTVAGISHHPNEGLGDQWVLLDEFALAGDGTDYVRLEAPVIDADCCDYSADAVKFEAAAVPGTISIKNAHYYTWYDADGDGDLGNNENVYLVNFIDNDTDGTPDTREYYMIDNTDDDNIIENGELILVTDEAEQNLIKPKIYDENGSIVGYKTDAEDLQNFANWYQYFRRRELAAKAVVANAINSLEGVSVGLYTINNGLRQPVRPIKLDMAASDLVDNQDTGYSTTGSWQESSASDEYEGSSHYTSQEGATATWRPNLPASGTYNVYAWWCYWGSRDTNALYTVNYAGGSDPIRINQQQDAGQWILLGPYNFDAGTSGTVTVTRDSQSTGSSTSADAVMFEEIGGATVNVDETGTLLDQLYGMESDGNTPLRTALENVGRYYHQDDGSDGNLGASPFSDAVQGGACQKAYAIVMTDGYWNGGSPGVGDVDGDQGDPFADDSSNTLADVAMYYYVTDLSDGLADQVPRKSCDTANHQHMTTYTLSFGVAGTIDLADMDGNGQPDLPGYADDPCFANAATPIPTWRDPYSGGSGRKIDDLWHAAVNGRGLFFSASNPQELVESMSAIIQDIKDPASGASVSVNGEELGTHSVLYQARYIADDWRGEVLAFPIDPISGAVLNGPDDVLWNASDKLEREAVTWDNRRIVTYNGVDAGIKFRYASLTTGQQDALKEADWGIGLTQDEQAQLILQYIRGRSDNIDSLNFRYRSRLLGDIVHSAPVLVGKSVSATSDGIDNDDDGFVDEYDINGEHEGGTIFVGANDGMLHAFNAQNGWERFAYVPNLVFENLKNLKDVNYNHRFFIDLTPYAKEVEISDSERKTYLVGGLGKGGKGYYALLIRQREDSDGDGVWTDIMNVDNFNDSTSEDTVKTMVQWEYPRADTANDGMDNDGDGTPDEAGEIDPDIGYSFSQGYVIKTNSAAHPWVVIFGNGYGSADNRAVLYVLDLDGVIVRKIDTAVSGNNGLSTPTLIDVNNDRQVDYAYAGDLQGNMWKFDLTSADSAHWEVAFSDGVNPKPLFTTVQPITSKPDVMRHCEERGYTVVFGTGKYLHNDDRTDLSQQTIYGIWDYGDDEDDGEYLGSFDRGTGELSNQPASVTLLGQTVVDVRDIDGHTYRTFSDNTADWNTVVDVDAEQNPNPDMHTGWYADFPNTSPYEGERVFKNLMIRDGKAYVISFIPDTSPCSGGGNSFLYIIDACTGARLATSQFEIGGTFDTLIQIGTDPDGEPIMAPPTGRAFTGTLHEPKIIGKPGTGLERLYMSDSTGVIEELDVPAERRGVLFWRER